MQTNDLTIELRGDQQQIALITLNRPGKRNALNDGLVLALRDVFQGMPHSVRAAVIHGNGDHFCAGLDLSELSERNAAAGLHHSRMWHHALDQVERGPVPVVAALHGAVVGGGLELASACHIRVADASSFFALPEGSRGIFVGGGGSVRIPRLIGTARMADMMFTGRVLSAEEGERAGLAQYLVPQGTALDKALELATRIAANAPLTNYALMQALPRIADQPADHGFFTEALISAIVQDAPEAKARVREFLEGRGPKVKKQ
ncbi:MAG: crotonase/enoyl-CoA hydratase family protein [Hydrogenophaga sp.]|uniref:crotonase/enoyl-CoA hydratase family protein n=1 Tax=Hydrogenophaga sp. TaxID=1904254 RepID=UPI001697E2E8|nr:crotonase/enoyl-CoA hydratase family protein [Hydrogenophaga sp.]NIM43938.1 crotonase/enoyl-CoA hydratase family protein [Hydrogenophaga sp.]NIN29002.1 crotonase/enoyl-CoA hydratase family protein [Hydrogenophaga sp.]NIN33479.1 crotonase/enoyl-CoA hydratase family protein [Hydrogenophaga sp.]NIN58138.1 crotonase/enoyl-CoA hydratase family protein [Hydrogenophaga sp.]NIO54436.1 crotonase/enoyl-CoA hydratase family protein [Hydrogenophaga sp.]